LHLALACLDLQPGDEVITTPITFCCSANVIEHVGSTPILADVLPDTLTIDPKQVEAAITPKTKVIMPVHFAGHAAEMDELVTLARTHHLAIIEDAAHALPASYRGQRIGTIGDFTAFSFYATKNLTTAEGGMLISPLEHANKARVLGLHGMDRDAWKRYSAEGSWFYEVVAPGFKYNMTDIQAAIGMVQLEHLESMQARRREIVSEYNSAFSTVSALEIPTSRNYVENAWHLYILRLNLEQLTIDRAGFIEQLKARNIGTSVHFIPLHLHPYYARKYAWQPERFPIAYQQYKRMISLPLHPNLSDKDIGDVIGAVLDVVKVFRR
jgi:dTDP-4-amino-4,6-dideoxygalactose transaminase